MQVVNKKWPIEKFLAMRKEVLASWPTGLDPQLDLDLTIKTLKNVPNHKNFAYKLMRAKEEKRTYVQPRAGVALLNEHIDLMRHLEAAGADFLPSTIDSYTRQNRYAEAEEGILVSQKEGRSMLNGFPAVNHGVSACKEVLDSVNVPLQARHGTPDARLLSEIIHAAGWTSNEGGGISYNLPYAKNISLADSIYYWQYCDRLVGFYEEQGIHINREPFGPLTGTLVPPSIAITIGIIEAMLAAEQGVKNITVGYGQCGNVNQDVAAIQMLQELTDDYLKRYGYDCYVTTVFHQWMGGFPQDEAKASGLIAMASTVAALAGATKMITKTPYESIGVPTKEINAFGIRESKMVVSLLKDQKMPSSEALDIEKEQIRKEVNCLMDHVFKLGDGDLAVGTIKAFELGVIDVPFAPSKQNQNKILPARDNEGCVRILEFGNLGMSDDIKAFHKAKLDERAKTEGRSITFQMTVDDVYAVSMGEMIGRPQKARK
ncbi:MAG: methylaspartate mutase subunit E [Tenericutes bacterium GWC2_34_14]|nr:MAG: methylaspartate mutase subunit E [Tenericutes bacterium GWA2_35_7]OHE28239.1 MAG: methylaspartate mutase subunit E [Tenericutes bacterium GWC2_34_14]OHE33135.1 MAG: methylaspartate mutase subunit E [Tenericutes bacterium GWE2_34_108]OHE36255.1 MAG: methylaspartate mutase subunit E [Tenericutes bacterium GWF1_35_14]OHE38703.1 MAG: methylaspartate mutase subunit E [Tenericutes bacterium GWF2_35_184]OHE44797.1 MAG: methylaspartate mutase subunit E [Tenericutes bacterium RIFOXYA2_FULL_36_3